MLRVCVLVAVAGLPLWAQPAGTEFFEKKIRPVLAANCYACHGSNLKTPMGGLVLDTRSGLRKGGASGPVVTPGNPAGSRLLQALRYTDTKLQMPPTGKLGDAVVADFEQWIAAGAPDPRVDEAPATPARAGPGMDLETGRKWWAFQPVRAVASPRVKDTAWPRTKIDSFLLAKLEAKALPPSPPADARTLMRRVYLDLTGVKPSYEEVEAFASDTSANRYEKLVDRLLASSHYGERWGRYWLDVARYAEDNPTSEATNPPYPYAWRYRDWVIEAVNQDLPYDRFVKLQLAADQMPGATRADLRALGFLGTAPVYHKDARLSKEVIETLASDDWDERVDAVSRSFLGLTVACARCHDHKFDPILTKDYYSLASVFASTMAVERPLTNVDPQTETRFLWIEERLFDLDYRAKLMANEPGTKPEEAAQKVVRYKAEVDQLQAEMQGLKDRYPELAAHVEKFDADTTRKRDRSEADPAAPFVNAVYDAGFWVDGADPDLTMLDYRPGVPRDLPVFLRGNVAAPGEPAPRQFLTVLSKPSDGAFQQGSGRLELAEKIFSNAAPLAARVVVNRVWGWHFGKPLAATPSDFGSQGERPSHPELLDDLAARFIEQGWSLKWLHREIVLSAAYQQASLPREEGERADPANQLLWRMNPRRLDVEAFRDSLLQAAGTLDEAMYGPSKDLDADGNTRRTVYGKVSRSRLHTVLRLYDFPDASQHSPGRELTTTPLQQLFVLNSPFFEEQSEALAAAVSADPDRASQVHSLYHRVFAREPSAKELDLALSYLEEGTLREYSQALLATNELIFWP